ncbi:ankyrin repeat domain-containing protein [Anaplasma phagocytophilum]|uniref:ankyrin repeat domain-containing protein n=1 Tax=Anaplasma phagocytophilum TaxID=948 RepID=UPI00201A55AB
MSAILHGQAGVAAHYNADYLMHKGDGVRVVSAGIVRAGGALFYDIAGEYGYSVSMIPVNLSKDVNLASAVSSELYIENEDSQESSEKGEEAGVDGGAEKVSTDTGDGSLSGATDVEPEKKIVLEGQEDNAQNYKRWKIRRPANPLTEAAGQDLENSHMPSYQSVMDLYQNAFSCAGANDVTGLRAILHEITSYGKSKAFLLEELRTTEKDNLLLYAVKHDAVDAVRYLLWEGSDYNVTDKNGETPLRIAVSSGSMEMINLISEMQRGINLEAEKGVTDDVELYASSDKARNR